MIIMLIHVHPPSKKKQNAKTRHHLLQDYSQLVSRYFTGAPFNKISRPLVATVRSPKRTSLPEQQLCLGYMAGDSRQWLKTGCIKSFPSHWNTPLILTACKNHHFQYLLQAETTLMEVSKYSHNHTWYPTNPKD